MARRIPISRVRSIPRAVRDRVTPRAATAMARVRRRAVTAKERSKIRRASFLSPACE